MDNRHKERLGLSDYFPRQVCIFFLFFKFRYNLYTTKPTVLKCKGQYPCLTRHPNQDTEQITRRLQFTKGTPPLTSSPDDCF